MKTIYLVKKDPSLPGNDDNWITMNGYEFARFMETEEGKKRRKSFGKLYAEDFNDLMIIAECGEKMATELRKENDHFDYLLEEKRKSKVTVYSFDALVENERGDEDGRIDGIFGLEANEASVEHTVINKMDIRRMYEGFQLLDNDHIEVIYRLFFCDRKYSGKEIAAQLGISESMVTVRKNRALGILRKYMEI